MKHHHNIIISFILITYEYEFQEHVANTMERKTENEKTDVVLFSVDGLKELDGGKSEGKL